MITATTDGPHEQASAAATAADVHIEHVTDPARLDELVTLFDTIWAPGGSGVSTPVLRSLTHGGHYVVGAFRRGQLVGATAAFFVQPLGLVLHSHITGVLNGDAGTGVGRALKMHQRAWAADQGVERITWTYDPLVARNAYFNLHRLGAQPVEYLVDFYGPLGPATVSGQDSDRLLVAWSVTDDAPRDRSDPRGAADTCVMLSVGPDWSPVEHHAEPGPTSTITISVPPDIDALRMRSPQLVGAWRLALRRALEPLVTRSMWRLNTFTRAGSYVFERVTVPPQ